MRAFKPLLPFGSQTVIESCIKFLRDAGLKNIVVVTGQDQRAEEMKGHLKDALVTFAVNPDAASEMSDSIACGLRVLPNTTKAVLITPADHPAVPFEVVSLLISEWENGTRLVLPEWNGRGGHPVIVDLSLREELAHLDPELGLRGLFEAHRHEVKRVPVNSNYIARDMDTWDDYAALHEEVFGVLPPKGPIVRQS